jgi:hypothetical protein
LATCNSAAVIAIIAATLPVTSMTIEKIRGELPPILVVA